MCMNVANGKIQKLFEISDLPDSVDQGMFYISPNGKMVLMRGVMEDENGNKRSALIFWDGKTKKIIETDSWLIKPLFTDEYLIFEEKLIGKWKGKEGKMLLVSESMQEKIYNCRYNETYKCHGA